MFVAAAAESIISCLDVLDSLSAFEYRFSFFPSVCLALAMTVLLAEIIDVKSGLNHILSSRGQGDGGQDRILANYGIVKKVIEQKCGIMFPVAYIGLGQTHRKFV